MKVEMWNVIWKTIVPWALNIELSRYVVNRLNYSPKAIGVPGFPLESLERHPVKSCPNEVFN